MGEIDVVQLVAQQRQVLQLVVDQLVRLGRMRGQAGGIVEADLAEHAQRLDAERADAAGGEFGG